MRNFLKILLALSLSLLLAACNSSSVIRHNPGNIVQVAQGNGSFSTLVTALQTTGLDKTLAQEHSAFTVFAPTDEAFAKLGQDTINALLNDKDRLTDILLYHVISGNKINAATAITAAGLTLTTANKDDIGIGLQGDKLFINASQVVAPDVIASNGIIHAIDTVLIPTVDAPAAANIPNVASAAGNFTKLVNALVSTKLDTVLADETKQFTVFAPTDDAFNALGDISGLTNDQLKNILLYHVVDNKEINAAALTAIVGNKVKMANGSNLSVSAKNDSLLVNESKVVAPNVDANNGIIHVIDKVLIPPS